MYRSNPSASVGLTAVNGSAATFMRSDGAPALDVGIDPTWTGTHTFSDTVSVPSSGGTAIWALDTTASSTLSINNDAIGYPFGSANNFAGMLIVNDEATDGSIAAFLLGGGVSFMYGQTVIFSTTVDTASKINIYVNGSGYIAIQNKTGVTRTIRITAIRVGATN